MQTYNHDICSITKRLNRFQSELALSVSSSVPEMNEFDFGRAKSYLDSLVTYHDWVMDQPQLDLPESHPKIIDIPEAPVFPEIENESIEDIVRLIGIAREELVNSASSRKPAGLIKFDSARFTSVISKIEKLMDDFIAKATPLDLPESSPKAVMVASGKKGV